MRPEASVGVFPKAAKLDHIFTQKHVMKSRIKENPIKHIKDALDKAGKTGSRPLMNTINVMRAEFCLRRPDLLQHEKCLKFLMEKCMVQTSGYGYCTEFHEILEKECNKGEVLPGEKEACDYHNELQTKVKDEEPTPESTTTVAPTTTAPPRTDPTEAPDASKIVDEAAPRVDDDSADDDDANDDANDGAGVGVSDLASAAPAPAAAGSPAPSPGAPAAPGPGPAPLPPAHAVVTNFDKKWRDLPEQGYDEHSDPKWVQHQDFDTQTGDWQSEWPSWDETEGQSTDRICEERPDHLWCKLWLKDRGRGSPIPEHVSASQPSSSAQQSGSHTERKGAGRVSTREQVVEQTKESQENVETGAAATGDQFGDAADQTSEVLPPGMSPTEKDLKDGQESKAQGVSASGHDLPPGMLTHPDDYESKLALRAEETDSASPDISFGDDNDFASDDVNYDDPEAVDATLNMELKEDSELTQKSL